MAHAFLSLFFVILHNDLTLCDFYYYKLTCMAMAIQKSLRNKPQQVDI